MNLEVHTCVTSRRQSIRCIVEDLIHSPNSLSTNYTNYFDALYSVKSMLSAIIFIPGSSVLISKYCFCMKCIVPRVGSAYHMIEMIFAKLL